MGFTMEMPILSKGRVWCSHDKTCIGTADDHYTLQDMLGEGSYGIVYKAIRAKDANLCAVKVIDVTRIGFGGDCEGVKAAESMALREISTLRLLSSHPGIIGFQDAFSSDTSKQIFIITEFVPGGDLFSHMVPRTDPLREGEAAHIVAQLSDALAFCHSHGVAHRDLKLENVLVTNLDVRLTEQTGVDNSTVSLMSEALFSVKLCDFGFAKQVFSGIAKTPLMLGGTRAYAAPESELQDKTLRQSYDAFKADAFSLGTVMYVLLCRAFPTKDGSEGMHRQHKRWPTLSISARSLVDGLLKHNPTDRTSVSEVCKYDWLAPCARTSTKHTSSTDSDWMVSRQLTQACQAPRSHVQVSDPARLSLLALQRALVMLQRERALACSAIAGAPGFDGSSISCSGQFQLHTTLTKKRMYEARDLLGQCSNFNSRDALCALLCELTPIRELVMSTADSVAKSQNRAVPLEIFDEVYLAYNRSCSTLIEIVAKALQALHPEGPKLHLLVQRYRLFSAAAEQLGRERAFVCGQAQPECKSTKGMQYSIASLSTEKMLRLSEILGARKVLIGTTNSGDIVSTSAGLVSTLLGDGEAPLLSKADLSALECIEQQVLTPSDNRAMPTVEWYQAITRLLNDIHSRIAINLVEDVQLASPRAGA